MNINLRCAREPAFMSLSRTAFKQGAKIGKYVGIYFIYLKKTGSCAFKMAGSFKFEGFILLLLPDKK